VRGGRGKGPIGTGCVGEFELSTQGNLPGGYERKKIGKRKNQRAERPQEHGRGATPTQSSSEISLIPQQEKNLRRTKLNKRHFKAS